MESEWVHISQIGQELIATEAKDGYTELIYIVLSAIWSRLPLEHVKIIKMKCFSICTIYSIYSLLHPYEQNRVLFTIFFFF